MRQRQRCSDGQRRRGRRRWRRRRRDGDGDKGEARGGDDGDGGGEASGGSVATTGERARCAAAVCRRRAAAVWRRRAGAMAATTTWRARRSARSGGGVRRSIVIWRSGSGDGGRPARVWLDSDVLGYPSAARSSSPSPARRLQDLGKGYSQSKASLDLCVNVLVRPTRISSRQSQGLQGRVVPFGGARRGPDHRSRTAVQQRRPGRVPRFI